MRPTTGALALTFRNQRARVMFGRFRPDFCSGTGYGLEPKTSAPCNHSAPRLEDAEPTLSAQRGIEGKRLTRRRSCLRTGWVVYQ